METRKRNKPVSGMVTTQVSEKAGIGIGATMATKSVKSVKR